MLHLLPTGLLKGTSFLLTTSGVVLAVTSTLGEHVDDVIRFSGVLVGLLLAIVGFWLRSWLAKREAFEKETRDLVTKQGLVLARLRQESRDLMRDFAEEVRLRRRESERVESFRLWMVSTLSAVASHMGVTPAPLPNHPDSGEVRVTRVLEAVPIEEDEAG